MAYLKSTYACQFPLGDIFVVTSYSSTVFFLFTECLGEDMV